MLKRAGAVILCSAIAQAVPAQKAEIARFRVEQALDIAKVPADFPVGFCLLTAGDRQYVAYYDKDHQMTVASRRLDSNQWQYQTLPSKIGWDSHNFISIALDKDGQLHVSGNMHNDPLVYFRTEIPGDITTLKKQSMTGELENRVTYPKFLTDLNGDLVFNYRHGMSGNGINLYNKYDCATCSWTRLLDTPLFDGERKMSAYPLGPVRGVDGWFHVVWVWRDTGDCATNHHLSYARSKDLIHWESFFGEKVELPITLRDEKLWVDPIPSHGGIINGCQKLVFNSNNRPVISYHKSDANGNMQIYAARPEAGKWAVHQLTDWDKPVVFEGRGSMGLIGIRIGQPVLAEPGVFTISYTHRDYGSGRLVFDEKTLRPLNKTLPDVPEYPKELNTVQSDFPGMEIQRAADIGDPGDENIRYLLQWETLGRNQDKARAPPLPKPGMLKLYKLERHP